MNDHWNIFMNDKCLPIQGPDLVIHQTKECLDKMGEWCKTHHADSGKFYMQSLGS